LIGQWHHMPLSHLNFQFLMIISFLLSLNHLILHELRLIFQLWNTIRIVISIYQRNTWMNFQMGQLLSFLDHRRVFIPKMDLHDFFREDCNEDQLWCSRQSNLQTNEHEFHVCYWGLNLLLSSILLWVQELNLD
jgi:hypothetical protein